MSNLTSEELRAALEFATSRNYVDIEMEAREAEGAIRILSAAVRELYEALESAESILQFDRGLSDEPEIVNRYRAALEDKDA